MGIPFESEALRYDVFLSHSSADEQAVEELAQRLRGEGLEPFLDKWHLIPGEPWQEALETALEESRTCAVFLGPRGISPWETEEMRVALDKRTGDPGFRVIPVLLPEAGEIPERLPSFLRRMTWVEFRWDLDDGAAFHSLVCGIRGVAPGPPGAPSGEVPASRCPFRGLEAFREEDAGLFFGRDNLVRRLVDHLRDKRFLAVIGPSGSGKSSVVRAGLIPALRRGALPESNLWRPVVMEPHERPLTTLAVHLAGLFEDDALELEKKLRGSPKALHTLAASAFRDQPPQARLLLVVDQFEEVFTVCEDEQERRAFIDNLLDASGLARGRVTVVLTLRADFYAQATNYSELGDRFSDDQVVVSPMDETELRAAIKAPTARAGLELDEGLPEKILEDVRRQDGVQPLLEHTLLELWNRRRGHRLTFEAYHEIGGVQGALTHRAEEVYASLDKKQQELARHVLLRLVRPGEGTEDTRRRACLSELNLPDTPTSAIEDVVRRLADGRLVSTDYRQDLGEVVNVAHEALIRNWRRLRDWVDAEREVLRFHRRLAERAEEWERLDRDSGSLLAGAQLREARRWAAEPGRRLNDLEREFLRASRRRLFVRRAAAAAVVLALALVVFTARRQVRIRELVTQVEEAGVAETLEPLRRLLVDHRLDPRKLVPYLRDKEGLFELFEKGPVNVDERLRGEAVLSAARALLVLSEEQDGDLRLRVLGTMIWALDYFPGRDAKLAEAARELRGLALAPLRGERPPPEVEGLDWVRLETVLLLAHEVTNEDYRRLFPDHPGPDRLPAVNVNWYEAYVYAAWLGGRLPTRAEWQSAARAGCPSDYCGRDGRAAVVDAVAWYSGNSEGRLHPVAELEPNRLGLHDMYGNAWEWVADWREGEPSPARPWGPPEGRYRVVCGGGFDDDVAKLRRESHARPRSEPMDFSFRVVLE